MESSKFAVNSVGTARNIPPSNNVDGLDGVLVVECTASIGLTNFGVPMSSACAVDCSIFLRGNESWRLISEHVCVIGLGGLTVFAAYIREADFPVSIKLDYSDLVPGSLTRSCVHLLDRSKHMIRFVEADDK